MRSQKQVRRAVKVRSLKNAAAGKWKTYRKCLEDRKTWQNNAILTRHQHSSSTLAPPPPRHRRIKDPKQRSPEELAERQRLREQRRLVKKLAKQRASTSTVPEIKKEKKLKETSNNDSPRNVAAERKTTTKAIGVKNSMKKETTKTKRLMNEQTQHMVNVTNQKVAAKKFNKLKTTKVPKLQNELESKHQYVKDERLPISVDEQKISQSLSPMKIERKELLQSKKQTIGTDKTDKKSSEEKRGRIKEIDKKAKNDKMQSSIPTQMIESQEPPIVPTVLNSFSEIENDDKQTEVHASTKKTEAIISKEQKPKKKNRQLNANTLLEKNDFVKDDKHEKNNEEANVDVAKIVAGRGEKKKGGNHHDDKLQSKSMECNNKDMVPVSGIVVDEKSTSDFPEIQKDDVTNNEIFKQQKQQQSSENDSTVFTKNNKILPCHLAKLKNEIQPNEDLCNITKVEEEFVKNDTLLANEDSKRSESKIEEISNIRSQQNGQRDEDDVEWKHFIGKNLHHNNIKTESYRKSFESIPNKFIPEEGTEHIEEFCTKEIDKSMHIKELLSKDDNFIARDHDNKDEVIEFISGFANLVNAKCAAENVFADILHAEVIETTRFDVSEENLPHISEKEDIVEKISKNSDERKRIDLKSDLDDNTVDKAHAKVDSENEKSGQIKVNDYHLLSSPVNAAAAASLINFKNLHYGMNDQTKKQEKDITEKKEEKELDEAVAHLVENQNYALENAEFKIEKIMDHIVLSDDKIPKDSGIFCFLRLEKTLSKTEMKMKAFIPEELEMKMAKLTEKHPEALDATKLNLSDNIIGDVSVASFAKKAKYEMDVEKKERNAQVLQRDGISRVPIARERIYKLLPRDIQFCVHMIEEYGENYEAMAKDQGNIFRDSAKGIARRIRIFKESPQYEAYLKQKIEKNGAVA